MITFLIILFVFIFIVADLAYVEFDCVIPNRYKNVYNKYIIKEVEYMGKPHYCARVVVGYFLFFIPIYVYLRSYDFKYERINLNNPDVTLFKDKESLENCLDDLYNEHVELVKVRKQL